MRKGSNGALVAFGASLALVAGWLLLGPRQDPRGPELEPLREPRQALDGRSDVPALPDLAPGSRRGGAGSTERGEASRAAAASEAGATVAGRVLDEADRGVAGVSVRLLRAGPSRRVATDEEGRFAFAGVERGLQRLFVEPHSLPPGFLPPWRQQVPRLYDGSATGIHGTSLRIADAAPREVDLRVFRAATVTGRVVEAGGRPLGGALVQLHGEHGRVHSARSDGQGLFRIERAYPGLHALSATLAGSHPDSRADAPLPLEVVVAPGSTHAAPDLVAGAGGCVLSGVVVDEQDTPMSGLRVTCRAEELRPIPLSWESTTDDGGHFRIGRLPAAALSITFDDSAAPARRVEATQLSLSTIGAPSELDVGTIRVENRRPFQIAGTVVLEPRWSADRGLDGGSLEVWVRDPATLRKLEPLLTARIPASDPVGPGVGAPEFAWACATPHAAVELVVRLRSSRGEELERSVIVEPRADERRALEIAFP